MNRTLPLLALLACAVPALAQTAVAPIDSAAPSSVAPVSSDAALRREIQAAVAAVDSEADVRVTLTAGVARLEGEVESPERRDDYAALVASFDAVRFVDNQLGLSLAADPVEEVQSELDRVSKSAVARVRLAAAHLPLAVIALLVFALGWIGARVLTRWELPFRLLSETPLVQQVVQQALRFVLVALAAIAALELLDLTAVVGAVVGTAGVAGLALGFAFRDIAENYLASLILSMRRPFAQNDFVKIGEHAGKVVRMTTSETILMTLDGNHLAVPNAQVFKSVVLNYTRNPLRRFDFEVGIGCDARAGQALELALSTLEQREGVLAEPPPLAWVDRLGDSTVVLTIMGWVDQRRHDFSKVKGAAIQAVKRAFEQAEIDMPYPIQQVRIVRPGQEPPKPAPALVEEVADVSVDDAVEKQIEAERQVAERVDDGAEADLLEPEPVGAGAG